MHEFIFDERFKIFLSWERPIRLESHLALPARIRSLRSAFAPEAAGNTRAPLILESGRLMHSGKYASKTALSSAHEPGLALPALGRPDYFEAMGLCSGSPAAGLRIGYEQRLAPWLSLETAIGAAYSNTSLFTTPTGNSPEPYRFTPGLQLGMSFALQLGQADPSEAASSPHLVLQTSASP